MKQIISILLIVFSVALKAQNAQFGYWSPNKDTLRILIVFAEVIGDPLSEQTSTAEWPEGQLPQNPQKIVSFNFKTDISQNGFLTRYFYYASFGQFIVLGDYLPNLVQIPYNELIQSGDQNVFDKLNTYPGDIYSAGGYSLMAHHFDEWTYPQTPGSAKTKWPDNKIDMMLIIWRTNSNISTVNNCGSMNCGEYLYPLKNKLGVNEIGRMISNDFSAEQIIRHEFSHSLLGGDYMHAGGSGTGTRLFIEDIGGYSMLSSWNSSSASCNAWDRQRMGWKNPIKQHQISALKVPSMTEINTDLTYFAQTSNDSLVILLRDFGSTGDALRIKLPYCPNALDGKPNQYLWIENHQKTLPEFDHKSNSGKGIYAYIQIGKDNYSDFIGSNSYLYPLPASGRWDYQIVFPAPIILNNNYLKTFQPFPFQAPFASTDSLMSNPFNGNHHLTLLTHDFTNNPQFANTLFSNELINIPKIYYKKNTIASDLTTIDYPIFGSNYDAYCPGDEISMSTNPTPFPVCTYTTPFPTSAQANSHSQVHCPFPNPSISDNQTVYLNGIIIKVLEEKPNGDIVISVRFSNKEVAKNVRWCGQITLNEKIIVKENVTLLLDQGKTPTNPIVQLYDNETPVYSAKTVFTSNTNSIILLKSGSVLEIKNGSSLFLKNKSKVIIEPGATLRVKSDSKIIMEDLAEIQNSGTIIIEKGASLECKNNSISMTNNQALLQISGNVLIDNNSSLTILGKGNIQYFQDLLYSDVFKQVHGNGNSNIIFKGDDPLSLTFSVQEGMFITGMGMKNIQFEKTKINLNTGCGITLYENSDSVMFNGCEINTLTSHTAANCIITVSGPSYLIVNETSFSSCLIGLNVITPLDSSTNIQIKNSNFLHCTSGLKILNNNATIENCIFNNNVKGLQLHGIYNGVSTIINCLFQLNVSGAEIMAGYHSVLNFTECEFIQNHLLGIGVSGNCFVNIGCSKFAGNRQSGIVITNGTTLNMSNNAGHSYFMEPEYCVYSINGNDVHLENGNNYIYSQSTEQGKILSGTLSAYNSSGNFVSSYSASGNQWNPQNSAPSQNEFSLFSGLSDNPQILPVAAGYNMVWSACQNSSDKLESDFLMVKMPTDFLWETFNLNNLENPSENVIPQYLQDYSDNILCLHHYLANLSEQIVTADFTSICSPLFDITFSENNILDDKEIGSMALIQYENGSLFLTIPSAEKTDRIMIYSSDGKALTLPFSNNGIYTEQLSAGIYFLVLFPENGTPKSEKFVVLDSY